MLHRFPALQILAAGVYFLPILSQAGNPIMVAVSEAGRRIREVEVKPTDDAVRLADQLKAEVGRLAAA